MAGPGPERTGARPSWLAVSLALPPAGLEHLLVEALRRSGARSVERTGERVEAHFPFPGEVDPFLRRVAGAVRTACGEEAAVLGWRSLAQDEWAGTWRDAHPPRPVGRRFRIVAEGWEDPSDGAEGDRLVLRLPAGVGFGTGEHPTTRICLRLLEDTVGRGQRVVDVGAGSGILTVAAALLGAGAVEGFEADALSAEAARRALRLNGVHRRARIHTRRISPGGPVPGAPFDGAVANLEGPLLLPLLSPMAQSVHPEGWVLLSGVSGSEVVPLREAAGRAGLLLRAQVTEGGWWCGRFERTQDLAGASVPERRVSGRG